MSSAAARDKGLRQGVWASVGLAAIYFFLSYAVYFSKDTFHPTIKEILDPLFLKTSMALIHLFGAFAALYYVWSIGRKKNRGSIFFLLLWIALDLIGSLWSGPDILTPVYGIFFLGAMNAYRSQHPQNAKLQ